MTLTHEHLLIDMGQYFEPHEDPALARELEGPLAIEMPGVMKHNYRATRDNQFLDSPELALKEALRFKARGGATICDLTTNGIRVPGQAEHFLLVLDKAFPLATKLVQHLPLFRVSRPLDELGHLRQFLVNLLTNGLRRAGEAVCLSRVGNEHGVLLGADRGEQINPQAIDHPGGLAHHVNQVACAGLDAAQLGDIALCHVPVLIGEIVVYIEHQCAGVDGAHHVDPSVIIRCGEVSREVAGELAASVRSRMNATYGIGITGIAGQLGIYAVRLSVVDDVLEPDVLIVEEAIPESVRAALAAMGHRVQTTRAMGNAHGLMIEYNSDNQPVRFVGAADPRGAGAAKGY